jgi:hypothetical protein
MKRKPIRIPPPELQIDFSFLLSQIRNEYLQEALSETVEKMNIPKIDKELADFVPTTDLALLASHGLRGELIYALPCILLVNPRLLGYYRLLLGFSQKMFYGSECAVSSFKSMEEKGVMSEYNKKILKPLCKGLVNSASFLLHGIGADRISRELIDDLTLLTLGPQLRGGANVRKGIAEIIKVFEIIHRIVISHVKESDSRRIQIENAAGRGVLIEFSADPDIIIREHMSQESYRNIIAIEVKGGTDFSNIHNRVGEAEKSHQKARQAGFVECWTVVNVDRIDIAMAKRESPSTNKFYRISQLEAGKGSEFCDFRDRIISLTGIPSI